MSSAHNLAADLRALGELQAARDLDQDTLDRKRRILGEAHPETLSSAHNLAADLRALAEADDHRLKPDRDSKPPGDARPAAGRRQRR